MSEKRKQHPIQFELTHLRDNDSRNAPEIREHIDFPAMLNGMSATLSDWSHPISRNSIPLG
jgi:hypothetical protein